VSGESYAGKYVPAITFKIHTMNEVLTDKSRIINLKASEQEEPILRLSDLQLQRQRSRRLARFSK
jgi:hypothetical protein